MDEAQMTINGQQLEAGDVMTLRVAMEHYHSWLAENGLGEDEQGKAICSGYMTRIEKMRVLMGYGG